MAKGSRLPGKEGVRVGVIPIAFTFLSMGTGEPDTSKVVCPVRGGLRPVLPKLGVIQGDGSQRFMRTFENLLGVWVRTLVQLPPSGCMRDGSTLMPSPDTRRYGARQG